MLEYAGVLYQHGEINKLYGPFPQVKNDSSTINGWNYFSFGFYTKDEGINDLRIKLSDGKTLALCLMFYLQDNDLILSLYKNEILTTMNSTINTILTVNPKIDYLELLTIIESNLQSIFKEK